MNQARNKKSLSFDPSRSIKRAKANVGQEFSWSLKVGRKTYRWTSNKSRIDLIRKGLPYSAIENISDKANLPIKRVLALVELPQTTYNKKKKDKELLDKRDAEVILVLSEVLDLGLIVFNQEKDKFHRWLKKTNISLGGVSPESLFDSLTGIEDVRNALQRLEYGNFS